MSSFERLGMTDVGSRRRVKGFWRFWLLSLLGVIGYVVWQNYRFIEAGMLRPRFAIIHEAYDFNLMVFPISLLVFALILGITSIFWNRASRQLRRMGWFYASVGFVLFGVRYYVTHIEPERLVIRKIRLETGKLSKPVRLLHISDIQAGSVGPYQRRIFERIKELEPDIIINTGDFLQVVPPATFADSFVELHQLIESVNPRLGTYAVFGDTERELYRIHPDELEPLVMLSSSSIPIDTGGGVLSLHGLSLYESKNEAWALRSIQRWLEGSFSSDFRILFGHAPDYSLEVREQPIDLCLAGHTHGGQVVLPFLGPLVIDSEVPKEWSKGFHHIGVPFLNVSAGAGSNRFGGLPPMRFNCPTEMTLIELLPVE